MAAVHAFGRWKGKGAAALGHQADGAGTGEVAEFVGPGASGVDHGASLYLSAVGQCEEPVVFAALQGADLGLCPQVAAALAQAADKALVQAMHVDIAGAGVEKAVHQHFGVQAGYEGQKLSGRQAGEAGRVALGLGEGGVQGFLLIRACHVEHAARGEQRCFGKAGGWVVQHVTAGPGQGLGGLAAVLGVIQRGRAAGGVVAGLRFALQYQHRRWRVAARLGQLPGHRAAGHAAADDHKIPNLHLELPFRRRVLIGPCRVCYIKNDSCLNLITGFKRRIWLWLFCLAPPSAGKA